VDTGADAIGSARGEPECDTERDRWARGVILPAQLENAVEIGWTAQRDRAVISGE
jgi:hypothetical protein